MTTNEHETAFTTTVSVKNERFEDLLINFFEGGNYWLKVLFTDIANEADKNGGEFRVLKQIMMGGTVICYDLEDVNEKLGELTLEKMKKALQAMANGMDLKEKENEHLKSHFNNFITENDDFETADVVIQIAVMGEIVFG